MTTSSGDGVQINIKLTSRDEFRFLTDLVLKHSKAEHTFLALHDGNSGTTRIRGSCGLGDGGLRAQRDL